jgi:formylglycine-generating enzyme required for sulfatase activity
VAAKVQSALVTLVFLLGSALCARAQIGPEVTVKLKKPPATKVTPKPAEKPETRVTPQPVPGTVRENPKDGLKYVWIPPGTFMMGCSPGESECFDDEKPSHRVTVGKAFWIGQTEVTVGAYKRFASARGRAMPDAPGFNPGWSNERMPIMSVNWADATEYCHWADGRLPTEAEWEYAARAGSTAARYGPLEEIAWVNVNSGGGAHEAAQKRPNAWSLYDMLGNVWEWVNDWYDEGYYWHYQSQDPPGPSSGQERVMRGGSWNATYTLDRVSMRIGRSPRSGIDSVGFRCVRDVVR